MKNFYKFGIIIIILLAVGFFGGFFTNEKSAYAGAGGNKLSGYAWSDNIGWVSFSCTNTNSCGTVNYNVAIDNDSGDMSGYAWSDNVGWISFNASDTSNCPKGKGNGSCPAKVAGNNLKGWAKVLSAGDGWDGWISLTGPNYGVSFDPNSGGFTGYAWGADVLGWVDFNAGSDPIIVDPLISAPIVTLDTTQKVVPYNGMTQLSWVNKNVSSCRASSGPWTGNWSGASAESGSTTVGPITSITTYTMTCANSVGDESSDTINIEVQPADFYLSSIGSPTIKLNGVKGTSTPVTIKIVPQNNFNSNVSLSVSSVPSKLSGADIRLTSSSLTKSRYNNGTEFSIVVSDPIPQGTYNIELKGTGGGINRYITIKLKVNDKDIDFEEF